METSVTLVDKAWKDNVDNRSMSRIMEEWFTKIICRYQSDNRKYHNLHHLEKKLRYFTEVEQKIKDRTAFVLALYFQ